ncbi:hypothetical protein DB30_03175 [Enhygromyxa salina]|uniref:Right handed beta helix domain-containing protein n=1 Tax=Enhygromyxa salina TaxID=215803 RepID=A0A0C1ZIW0_9BACT|nr:hypothetical protein DB30_03175 [Enhygromyxa salina]
MGLLASACVSLVPNDSHCRHAQGDQTCAERYGDARPFCTAATCDASSEGTYGCVAERPSDDCYYPCGGDNDVTVDNGCRFADDGDGDGDEPTHNGDENGDPGDEEGDAPCLDAGDCADDSAPFCDLDTGVCVGCGSMSDADGACAGVDPALPVCHADVCVACTPDKTQACAETAPICDVATNACVGCNDHDQCSDSACNLATGSCFDPAAVFYVDGGNKECEAADGTQSKPFCTLAEAIDAVTVPSRILISTVDEIHYEAEVVIADKTIALFAANDGPAPVLEGPEDKVAVAVTSSGQLYMRGVDIVRTENGLGLEINDGHAWVQQSRIVKNERGGIRVDGGTLRLEHSFVGGDADDVNAIEVLDGEVSIIYTTIVAGGDDSHAFVCETSSESTIRNSIIVSLGDSAEVMCDAVEIIDSFNEADSAEKFDDNSDWFEDWRDDFHLVPGKYPAILETLAIWRTGDPQKDIDGDPRPTADGTQDFAGADLP